MRVSIKAVASGATLAEAEPGDALLKYEGNWYFAPEAVDRTALHITDRTYTCPYKGTCHWVDHVGPDGATARDVAWVYAQPKPGHEVIRDRYGFYAGTRGETREG